MAVGSMWAKRERSGPKIGWSARGRKRWSGSAARSKSSRSGNGAGYIDRSQLVDSR